jgi:hypothetical protein
MAARWAAYLVHRIKRMVQGSGRVYADFQFPKLTAAYQAGRLEFFAEQAVLAEPTRFKAYLAAVRKLECRGTSHASAISRRLWNAGSQRTVSPLRAKDTSGPVPTGPAGRCGGLAKYPDSRMEDRGRRVRSGERSIGR